MSENLKAAEDDPGVGETPGLRGAAVLTLATVRVLPNTPYEVERRPRRPKLRFGL